LPSGPSRQPFWPLGTALFPCALGRLSERESLLTRQLSAARRPLHPSPERFSFSVAASNFFLFFPCGGFPQPPEGTEHGAQRSRPKFWISPAAPHPIPGGFSSRDQGPEGARGSKARGSPALAKGAYPPVLREWAFIPPMAMAFPEPAGFPPTPRPFAAPFPGQGPSNRMGPPEPSPRDGLATGWAQVFASNRRLFRGLRPARGPEALIGPRSLAWWNPAWVAHG